jgi:hypothetical protein
MIMDQFHHDITTTSPEMMIRKSSYPEVALFQSCELA